MSCEAVAADDDAPLTIWVSYCLLFNSVKDCYSVVNGGHIFF